MPPKFNAFEDFDGSFAFFAGASYRSLEALTFDDVIKRKISSPKALRFKEFVSEFYKFDVGTHFHFYQILKTTEKF